MSIEKQKVNSKILPCRCVASGMIMVKSAATRKSQAPSISADRLPVHTRTHGVEFQEAQHGRGNRVHNPRMAKNKHIGYTCTVCGTPKPL